MLVVLVFVVLVVLSFVVLQSIVYGCLKGGDISKGMGSVWKRNTKSKGAATCDGRVPQQ